MTTINPPAPQSAQLRFHMVVYKTARLLRSAMPMNVTIDDRLLEQAHKLGRHGTKTETVHAALEEYIWRR